MTKENTKIKKNLFSYSSLWKNFVFHNSVKPWITRDLCYDFLNIFAEKFSKKMA
jgi:hypothetical protein